MKVLSILCWFHNLCLWRLITSRTTPWHYNNHSPKNSLIWTHRDGAELWSLEPHQGPLTEPWRLLSWQHCGLMENQTSLLCTRPAPTLTLSYTVLSGRRGGGLGGGLRRCASGGMSPPTWRHSSCSYHRYDHLIVESIHYRRQRSAVVCARGSGTCNGRVLFFFTPFSASHNACSAAVEGLDEGVTTCDLWQCLR